jgi:serine/threonine-protein kinase
MMPRVVRKPVRTSRNEPLEPACGTVLSSAGMASEEITPGLVIAGRYRVERQLGEGGMGAVFLVQHVHTDELLALKVLNPAVVKDEVALERFKREARTPARIGSDYVVRVTDADVSPELGGVPFLVMEYLRGRDLDQMLLVQGPLSREDVVLYLRQAARALDKAHAMGIIHRDLKPENLFLSQREDGTPWVKVLDFGIAKLTEGSGLGTKTGTGQIFGTPMFMSPEQALAEHAKISPQTDVWALGLIAHKLLTGSDIWTAENLTHLLAQIAYVPMPVPSQRGATFGPEYDAWFARCCAREASERYPSAGEAMTALAEALKVSVEGTQPIPPVTESATMDSGAALAKTAMAPGGLKMSAGPLTRSDPLVGATPARRSGLRIAAGLIVLLVAGAGIWLVSAGPATEDGSPAGAESAPEPPTSVEAPIVEPVPAVEPAVVPSSTAPAEVPDAGRDAGRPASTGVAPQQTAKPLGTSPSPTASPSSTAPSSSSPSPSTAPSSSAAPRSSASAAPSGSASAKPRDPLGGRQ